MRLRLPSPLFSQYRHSFPIPTTWVMSWPSLKNLSEYFLHSRQLQSVSKQTIEEENEIQQFFTILLTFKFFFSCVFRSKISFLLISCAFPWFYHLHNWHISSLIFIPIWTISEVCFLACLVLFAFARKRFNQFSFFNTFLSLARLEGCWEVKWLMMMTSISGFLNFFVTLNLANWYNMLG